MKKKSIVLIVIALVLALVVYGLATGRLTIHGISLGGYTYDHADRYTAGGAQIPGRVTELDVSWIAGHVSVEHYDGSVIRLSETARRSMDGEEELHWWLDGETLYVKFAASGYRGVNGIQKSLTILVPGSFAAEQVKINVVSADVDAQLLSADEVAVNAVSGSVRVAVQQARSISVDTVSGGAAVEAAQLRTLDVNTVSGGVRICLPEELGFVAEVSSVSGSVSGSRAMQREDGGRYVSGDGQCRIGVHTVSGNVKLDQLAD